MDESVRTARHDRKVQQLRSEGLDELLDKNKPLVDDYIGEENPFVSPEQDMAWMPVVYLVKTLPNLTRVIYDCRNQFPPSLLSVLHSHHSQYRLYHQTFRLRSLRLKYGYLDPHKLALATSPCLYSITLRCSIQNEDGDPDQNPEALLELVAGLAPNLKEVFMIFLQSPNSKYPSLQPVRHSLPGFIHGQTGSLSSLSITGLVFPSPDKLQA